MKKLAAMAVASVLCVVSGSCKTGDPGNSSTGKVFDVRIAGAFGDGKTLDTSAIQRALDDCGRAGGGTVLFPEGVYLSKPIVLRNNTTLEFAQGATLKATDAPADFVDPERPGSFRAFVPFIGGKDLTNITITGPGTIDGSGMRWWGPAREAKRTNHVNPGYTLPRPKMIVLTRCHNLRVTNITLINSPCFHLVPSDCDGVLIDHVNITAPADSPNTDAIDPSNSRNVLITHCRLDVGDDNVAIKANRNSSSSPACEDITVSDCVMLHGHGMSIGSETSGGVRNVKVMRCDFQFTENGLRIKSPRGKGGLVEDISYSDITMKDVVPAITFTCYYPKIPASDTAQELTKMTPVFRNIQISNMKATCRRDAGVIVGLPESAIENLTLENVEISARTGLTIRNAKGIRFKNVNVRVETGQPFILENAEVEGLNGSR